MKFSSRKLIEYVLMGAILCTVVCSCQSEYASEVGSISSFENKRANTGEGYYESAMVALKEQRKSDAIASLKLVSRENATNAVYRMAQDMLRILDTPPPAAHSSTSYTGSSSVTSGSVTSSASSSSNETAPLLTEVKTSSNDCYYRGHELHVGPRGGCYYINSHGNKTYVNRAYCSGCY